MTKEQLEEALFSLDYVTGQLKVYGEKNDYFHELLLRHLKDVIKKIEADQSVETQTPT